MLFRTLPSRLFFAAAVLALPLAGSGCGRKACFTWTAAEGVCPAQSEALRFFSDPRCPGRVTSVESEPSLELDGKLCCYEVVANDAVDERGCGGFGGANSSGSFDESSAFAVSGGFGGSPPTPPCVTCGQAVDNIFGSPFCTDTTATLVNTLFACACSERCSAVCESDFCTSVPPGEECSVCLKDPDQGCGKELEACFADF